LWTRHRNGLALAPATYTARLTGDATLTENITVLIDPRVAEDGVTPADRRSSSITACVSPRLWSCEPDAGARGHSTARAGAVADPESCKIVNTLADKINTQLVRYGS
jgi:hypothetical protein